MWVLKYWLDILQYHIGVQILIREILQCHVAVDTNACSCVSQTVKWLESGLLIMWQCVIGRHQCFRTHIHPENGSSKCIWNVSSHPHDKNHNWKDNCKNFHCLWNFSSYTVHWLIYSVGVNVFDLCVGSICISVEHFYMIILLPTSWLLMFL